ncbi:DUF6461 domain-containing protein [Cryptosporangium minutisporangium]|uniref:DUF6461 domain-containing protein n=1 Tax=Cryptosporangium minutisporangium TaxID=113569 RepID=UPI0035F03253
MVQVSDDAIERLAGVVASRMASLADRIPAAPAAELGRWGAPEDAADFAPDVRRRSVPDRILARGLRPGRTPPGVSGGPTVSARPTPTPGPRPTPASRRLPRPSGPPAGVPVGQYGQRSVELGEPESAESPLAALRDAGPLLTERLLGALELVVGAEERAELPEITASLAPPPEGRFAFLSDGSDSVAMSAARLLERLHPGVAELVVASARRLAEHRLVGPLLTLTADDADEPAVAARHGTAYLTLGVATAGAVVDQIEVPDLVDRAAAVVGLGLGTAAVLLRQAEMPPTYRAALMARIRAEYRLPRQGYGSVRLTGHHFGLLDEAVATRAVPGPVDWTANGLVTTVDGGAVVRTGADTGAVNVRLEIRADPPREVEDGWEEIVEVSWRALEGRASVVGPDGAIAPPLQRQTPPWPGDYRLRVHARGRDDEDADYENYSLLVWSAPAAPEIVHRRTDRLGHGLRGEPLPAAPPRPERAYRWIQRSSLATAATVTVVTGASIEEVLRAFGADPLAFEEVHDPGFIATQEGVFVRDTGDAVLAVEFNGYRGSGVEVLRAASARGRAASMYWNVNAVTRLSFAERGEILAASEFWEESPTDPRVAEAMAGLDFAEPVDSTERSLVAVERFTGRGITPADLAAIEESGVCYLL